MFCMPQSPILSLIWNPVVSVMVRDTVELKAAMYSFGGVWDSTGYDGYDFSLVFRL